MSKKVVLGLSGGMDSTTLAAYYKNKRYEVYPIIFKYGSKHNKYENLAALNICQFYKFSIQFIDLSFIGEIFRSNLLNNQGEIPEGHYQEENMKLTVVPGRNLIFLSLMAGYAESIGAEIVAFGAHGGDHFIYPDTRPEFVFAANTAIYLSSGGKVRVEAPFLDLNKTEILKIGYSLSPNVPYELTRTCYKDQPLSCGRCGSCTERLESFKNIGKEDPIEYQK